MSEGAHPAGADRLAEVHARLTKAVQELVSGEDWAQMLATAARFTSYSWANSALIQAQCPQATRVAGYRTWQALGRQVRRGERGIAILAPVVKRMRVDEDTSDGKEREPLRVLRGFRVAHVFDVSATEGRPLPEVAPRLLDGEAPERLYEHLAAQVALAGYALLREDCAPANGETDFLAHTVRVRPDLSGAAATKTLCHELAHILLHERLAQNELRGGCRGRAEVEAESVAFVVCATAKLETGEYSFPYVARWAKGDLSVITSTAERVTSCARQIAETADIVAEEPDPSTSVLSTRDRTKVPGRSRHVAHARAQRTSSHEGRSR
jgi:antirestriction protein ArdC